MTPLDPLSSDHDPADTWPTGDALDRALAASLRAPPLPAGFHATLRRAIAREADAELRARRAALEADHARRMAGLRSGYVQLRRHTLAVALAAAFTAGAAASVGLPWLAATIGTDASTLAPLMAALIGIGVGAAVWVERFGLPRWR